MIDSFLEELLRDDVQEEGVMVGPGNIDSGAVWNGTGELLRTKAEAFCPVQVHVGMECKSWLLLETKTGLDKSQWVFPDDGVEWYGNREAKEAIHLFLAVKLRREKTLVYWFCEGESGLVAENRGVFRLVQTKKAKDEIRALFPAPAFGVIFHSFLPIFSPYPQPKPIFSVFRPNWERDSAQTAPLPGRHL